MTWIFIKKCELPATFIEITNPKKSSIIVGVIYRHPKTDVIDFKTSFLSKSVLLGDFNIDLMHNNEEKLKN